MTTLTIRIPEDKHERPKALARARNMSVNRRPALRAIQTRPHNARQRGLL